jgi:predicted nucleic acid-binding protein
VPRRKKDKGRPAPPLHLLDTHVILRFLIADDPPRAARAAALMGRVERAEESVELTDEVVTEAVWTLESFYNVPRAEIVERLAALLNLPGVPTPSAAW